MACYFAWSQPTAVKHIMELCTVVVSIQCLCVFNFISGEKNPTDLNNMLDCDCSSDKYSLNEPKCNIGVAFQMIVKSRSYQFLPTWQVGIIGLTVQLPLICLPGAL